MYEVLPMRNALSLCILVAWHAWPLRGWTSLKNNFWITHWVFSVEICTNRKPLGLDHVVIPGGAKIFQLCHRKPKAFVSTSINDRSFLLITKYHYTNFLFMCFSINWTHNYNDDDWKVIISRKGINCCMLHDSYTLGVGACIAVGTCIGVEVCIVVEACTGGGTCIVVGACIHRGGGMNRVMNRGKSMRTGAGVDSDGVKC